MNHLYRGKSATATEVYIHSIGGANLWFGTGRAKLNIAMILSKVLSPLSPNFGQNGGAYIARWQKSLSLSNYQTVAPPTLYRGT